MRPLNICHVVLSLEPGGLENGVVNVVNGLNDAEFNSSICCLQRTGEFAARIRPDVKITAMGLRAGNDVRLPVRMAGMFRLGKVDIVHTRNAEAFFYGWIAARLAGVPVFIHSEHGRTFPEKSLRARVQRLMLRNVDAAFAVSERLKLDLIREIGVRSDRFEVLYNGVDLAKFRPHAIAATKDSNHPTLRIGSVGRLVAVKNYALLLKAFVRLPKALRCKLVLVGDGPERPLLEQLASTLHIADRVEFAGHRDDVGQLLHSIDIFVLPSLSEGMSNTLLEAMAAGLPVLASDVGGNREIIEHEHNGLIFRSEDVEGAANQLARLVADADLRMALGIAAAERVRNKFSITAMLQGYEALYRRVWNQKFGTPIENAIH
jgi:sugar transferase (PEP-CTERM/EpsH1 system associated)